MSYEVMTPSAARGLLEAILWKPAIRWRIASIAVLSRIEWMSFRRNEVTHRASPQVLDFFADDHRAQRNTVALRDVDYVIETWFDMTDRAGPEDNTRKFEEMFERRLEKGQHYQQPYLGCRELVARVESAPETWKPIEPGVNRSLGLMFYDFEYGRTPARPLFFDARLSSGVLHVPPVGEVMRDNHAEATR